MEIITAIDDFITSIGIPEVIRPVIPFLLIIALMAVVGLSIFQLLHKRKFFDGKTKSFYIFVLPWIIGFILFTLGPMIYSLWMSFHDWGLVDEKVWIAAGNYKQMAKDPLVMKSLSVTFKYTLLAVPAQMVVSFLIATLLNTKIKGMGIFRTIFYLPTLVGGVAQAVLFTWIFNPSYGVVNVLLSKVGITGPAWLTDPKWALSTMILMSLWTVGSTVIIYLAGFQDIADSLYEAADLDGANVLQKYFHITIPHMTPIIFFNMVTAMIGAFQTFTQGYMFNGGTDNSLLFYAYYLYQNAFMWFKMGYGSALAWVLFIVILSFTLIVFRSSSMWVFYENEVQKKKKTKKNRKDEQIDENVEMVVVEEGRG